MRVAELSEEKRNELKAKARGREKTGKITTTLAKYETVVIINPDYLSNSINYSTNYRKIIDKIKEILKIDKVVNSKFEVEDIGLKRLAYTTMGLNEGYYMSFHYKTSPSYIADLEKYLRENAQCIKFITIREE